MSTYAKFIYFRRMSANSRQSPTSLTNPALLTSLFSVIY